MSFLTAEKHRETEGIGELRATRMTGLRRSELPRSSLSA